jgi:hypothetical protein
MVDDRGRLRARWSLALLWAAVCSAFAISLTRPALAEQTLCAKVKIEILQELTLERQAFDARMRINNGLDTLSLENVDVDVIFEDDDGNSVLASSDPSNTAALFFIRLDSMDGISDVSGAGAVAPSSDAEIHWLIIPAPGASGGQLEGKRYRIGANLKYRLGGELKEIAVTPDDITVKPLPSLALDYFLTRFVHADDPVTPAIEPSEPFTLGVRIKNSGQGSARNVAIESAQPRIVENLQGLLIGFLITGSFVDDAPAAPTLLINFGDIDPGRSRVGRWLMETTLAGEFEEFSASFTHADELGGKLTSLITSTNAHLLIHDVRVDAPGRDSIRDFLAEDPDAVRVYESESVDTAVTQQGAYSTLVLQTSSPGARTYRLTVPPTAGFVFVKVPDPGAGAFVVRRVTRGDGKVLPAENGWVSSEGVGSNVDHFINVFDSNGGGVYVVEVGAPTLGAVAPVLQFIADKTGVATTLISFLIEASDANGTIPVLSADALPVGASVSPSAPGRAIFSWTPTAAQTGTYPITFRASDGVFSSTRTPKIRVNSTTDTDGDGMDDAWEIAHFGNLDRDGTGDFDGDGISDLDEFLAGTDPTRSPMAPSEPVVIAPLFDAEVTSLHPTLSVLDSEHGDLAPTYEFEVYADAGLSQQVAHAAGIAEAPTATSWDVDVALADNATYYWRARSRDLRGATEWVGGRFFVNTANDGPGPFQVSSPRNGAGVTALTTLEVTNSVDPDRDSLRYAFSVSTDPGGANVVASAQSVVEGSAGTTSIVLETALAPGVYYWFATASDAHGAQRSTSVSSFRVLDSGYPPGRAGILSPAAGARIASANVDLLVTDAPASGLAPLTYFFEADTRATFDSLAKRTSGPVSEGAGMTAYTFTGLADDTHWYWRVRASDGTSDGAWSTADFRVDVANENPPAPTPANPGDDAFVELLQPRLALHPATDPDDEPISYHFEVHRNAAATQLVTSGIVPTPLFPLGVALTDKTTYWWRARAEDARGGVSDWSTPAAFHVELDGVNDAPTIRIDHPSQRIVVSDPTFPIRWTDSDPDNDATISLFANGAPIASAIHEDPDGDGDTFLWQLASVPAGTYHLSASIDDGAGSTSATACCDVVLPGCGDVDDDGFVTLRDAVILRRSLAGLGPGLAAPGKCNVFGPPGGGAGTCQSDDLAVLRRSLVRLWPGIAPVCGPAVDPGP